jgi:hypothetical protein
MAIPPSNGLPVDLKPTPAMLDPSLRSKMIKCSEAYRNMRKEVVKLERARFEAAEAALAAWKAIDDTLYLRKRDQLRFYSTVKPVRVITHRPLPESLPASPEKWCIPSSTALISGIPTTAEEAYVVPPPKAAPSPREIKKPDPAPFRRGREGFVPVILQPPWEKKKRGLAKGGEGERAVQHGACLRCALSEMVCSFEHEAGARRTEVQCKRCLRNKCQFCVRVLPLGMMQVDEEDVADGRGAQQQLGNERFTYAEADDVLGYRGRVFYVRNEEANSGALGSEELADFVTDMLRDRRVDVGGVQLSADEREVVQLPDWHWDVQRSRQGQERTVARWLTQCKKSDTLSLLLPDTVETQQFGPPTWREHCNIYWLRVFMRFLGRIRPEHLQRWIKIVKQPTEDERKRLEALES